MRVEKQRDRLNVQRHRLVNDLRSQISDLRLKNRTEGHKAQSTKHKAQKDKTLRPRPHVLGLVVRNGMTLTLIGVAFGLFGAVSLTRLSSSLLFDVTPTDPPTFVFVAVGLSLVALLACYIPARRATKVDPLVALREE